MSSPYFNGTTLQFQLRQDSVRGESFQVKARKLYESYRKWAEQSGEETLTETWFGTRMGTLFQKDHTETGTFYYGIGLAIGSPDEY